MNKALLKSLAIAAVVVWASNNIDPVKKVLGSEGGIFS